MIVDFKSPIYRPANRTLMLAKCAHDLYTHSLCHICHCRRRRRRFYQETTLGRKYLFRFTLYDHLIWFICISPTPYCDINTFTLAIYRTASYTHTIHKAQYCLNVKAQFCLFRKSINKTLQLIQYYGLIITRPKNTKCFPYHPREAHIFSCIKQCARITHRLRMYFKCIIQYGMIWYNIPTASINRSKWGWS